MRYPVSVWIDYWEHVSVEESIARLRKAGFTHGELSVIHLPQIMAAADPVKYGAQLKSYCDDLGFTVPQGHTSFTEGFVGPQALERLKPEMDMFAAWGIQKAVLHVNGGKDMEDKQARYDSWMENLRQLSEYVEGTGVTLCLENLNSMEETRKPENLLQMIRDAGGKNMGICLDTGHLHLSNTAGTTHVTHGDFIRLCGDKLQALHIVDNNGDNDTHQMPFSARTGVDWVDVMRGLRDIDYKGLFNLEILGERGGNDAIREAKLAFIQIMCREMLSDAFIAE